MFKRSAPSIEIADVSWIGFGGLKWCAWEEFQGQLDIEGKGRKVDEFGFRRPNKSEAGQLRKEFS